MKILTPNLKPENTIDFYSYFRIYKNIKSLHSFW